jgi:hypothetical protein
MLKSLSAISRLVTVFTPETYKKWVQKTHSHEFFSIGPMPRPYQMQYSIKTGLSANKTGVLAASTPCGKEIILRVANSISHGIYTG